jgi:hypothetical protein
MNKLIVFESVNKKLTFELSQKTANDLNYIWTDNNDNINELLAKNNVICNCYSKSLQINKLIIVHDIDENLQQMQQLKEIERTVSKVLSIETMGDMQIILQIIKKFIMN